jgi:hypothetical protein
MELVNPHFRKSVGFNWVLTGFQQKQLDLGCTIFFVSDQTSNPWEGVTSNGSHMLNDWLMGYEHNLGNKFLWVLQAYAGSYGLSEMILYLTKLWRALL